MTGFEDARLVEAKSRLILDPFIRDHAGGHYILTDKGNASAFLQRTVGDIMYNEPKNSRLVTVELKAERKWTGNLFLETWSNRNLDNRINHINHGSTPGWMYTSRADLLFYHFLDADKIVICDLFQLQRWAFINPSLKRGAGDLPGRISDFPEVPQGIYEQRNDTWGRKVAIAILQAEMNPAPPVWRVQQLKLRFFDEVDAA